MGNILSDTDEIPLPPPEAVNLESPEADKVVNFGTAAPNCQPQHTAQQLRQAQQQQQEEEEEEEEREAEPERWKPPAQQRPDHDAEMAAADKGQEVVMLSTAAPGPESLLSPSSSSSDHNKDTFTAPPMSPHAKHRRGSSSSLSHQPSGGSSQEEPRKRQHLQEIDPSSGQPKKLSYIQMAKMGYQELVNAIIRPPRADYKMEQLGPPAFNFCGKRFTRTDFTLRTKRGVNLECSHWEPVERATDRIPVVIYMHGNSSARIEVIPQLSYLLSLGLAVFSFDFAGSGKSDGEYVSLGYFEREDLSCVVAHLRATKVVSTIALWGRSMGAATALMFGDRDPSIACMILDSSFSDLTQLCEEMVEKGREQGIVVPNIVVAVAIRMLQGSVKKQAGFNIRSISPIAHADKCFIPALFVAGEHDDFIKKHHSEQIYEKYAGDKNLIIVEGDHNSPRPKFMFDSASIFLQTCLQIPNDWALSVPVSMNLMCPPWYFEIYQQRANRRRYQEAAQARDRVAHPKAGLLTNGFDHEEVGMTAERQRVIQASLFKMLGQADAVEGPATATTASLSEDTRR